MYVCMHVSMPASAPTKYFNMIGLIVGSTITVSVCAYFCSSTYDSVSS